ncbi:MAG: FISUMP domain-containing protein [Bacteroidales bacterium]
MKKISNLIVLILLVSGIAMLNGCKKKSDPPTLTTTAVSAITVTTATTGGNVTSDGGAEVTARGVCWGTTTKPVITGSKTSDAKGTGSFTSNLTGLTASTLYYVRAYATNSEGTSYGNEVSFTTSAIVGATLTTAVVTGVTATSAISGGNITADGGAAITAKGVCWATTADPTIAGSKTSETVGTGLGVFASTLTPLTPGTAYHVRAYATNSSGTTYGNDLPFTTEAVAPTVTTADPSGPTSTTAVSGGNVTANGGASVTARGVCWGTALNPTVAGPHTTDGTGDGAFVSNIAGLTSGTLYHVRAYATNSKGTSYGEDKTFSTTQVLVATVTTTAITTFTNISAVSGGNITANGGGTITASGVCWAVTANPVATGLHTTDGATTGTFVSNIAGLAEGTIYYVRAYATNSAGTAYGNQVQVLTMGSDIDGNLYKTVAIGTQVWMAENLKTIKLNENTNITNVTSGATWAALTTPGYAWYGNDEATNKPLYGALYNWHTVNTGILCPTGWHVPSDDEFKTLEMFLGMTQAQVDVSGWRGTDQGTQLKNTTGWTTGNGTNTSGFSALPGGYRFYVDGGFNSAGTISYWWSSTEINLDRSYGRQLDAAHADVERTNADKHAGKYVRCLK